MISLVGVEPVSLKLVDMILCFAWVITSDWHSNTKHHLTDYYTAHYISRMYEDSNYFLRETPVHYPIFLCAL